MATQGPNAGGTAISDASYGTHAWTNPSYATTINNSQYATFSFTGSSKTRYLNITNFGFSIPGGATIDGIIVDIRKYSTPSFSIKDDVVRLVKGGVVIGNNNKNLVSWSTTPNNNSYGSSSDLWGTTWTDSEINNSGFGIVLAVYSTQYKSVINGYVDHISITIHYTAGGGSAVKTVSGLAQASVKTVEGLAIASTKSIQGLV